ncbi:hypothetical protein D3C74_274740 [compost metagenome]
MSDPFASERIFADSSCGSVQQITPLLFSAFALVPLLAKLLYGKKLILSSASNIPFQYASSLSNTDFIRFPPHADVRQNPECVPPEQDGHTLFRVYFGYRRCISRVLSRMQIQCLPTSLCGLPKVHDIGFDVTGYSGLHKSVTTRTRNPSTFYGSSQV